MWSRDAVTSVLVLVCLTLGGGGAVPGRHDAGLVAATVVRHVHHGDGDGSGSTLMIPTDTPDDGDASSSALSSTGVAGVTTEDESSSSSLSSTGVSGTSGSTSGTTESGSLSLTSYEQAMAWVLNMEHEVDALSMEATKAESNLVRMDAEASNSEVKLEMENQAWMTLERDALANSQRVVHLGQVASDLSVKFGEIGNGTVSMLNQLETVRQGINTSDVSSKNVTKVEEIVKNATSGVTDQIAQVVADAKNWTDAVHTGVKEAVRKSLRGILQEERGMIKNLTEVVGAKDHGPCDPC